MKVKSIEIKNTYQEYQLGLPLNDPTHRLTKDEFDECTKVRREFICTDIEIEIIANIDEYKLGEILTITYDREEYKNMQVISSKVISEGEYSGKELLVLTGAKMGAI